MVRVDIDINNLESWESVPPSEAPKKYFGKVVSENGYIYVFDPKRNTLVRKQGYNLRMTNIFSGGEFISTSSYEEGTEKAKDISVTIPRPVPQKRRYTDKTRYTVPPIDATRAPTINYFFSSSASVGKTNFTLPVTIKDFAQYLLQHPAYDPRSYPNHHIVVYHLEDGCIKYKSHKNRFYSYKSV